MTNTALETLVIETATKSTYAASFTTIAAWMVSSEAGIIIGVTLATFGFLAGVIFQWRRDAREARDRREEHAERKRRVVREEVEHAMRVEHMKQGAPP